MVYIFSKSNRKNKKYRVTPDVWSDGESVCGWSK